MSGNNILVVVFLRGGMDGLHLVCPSTAPLLLQERHPKLRVDNKGDYAGFALEQNFGDEDFRLHPRAKFLKTMYDARQLAIIHACGSVAATHSHVEATEYMELGTPDSKTTPTGWLTRLIEQQQSNGPAPAIAIGSGLPLSLLACKPAIVVPHTRRMLLNSDTRYKELRKSILGSAYEGNTPVHINGAHTLAAADVFAKYLPKNDFGTLLDYTPATGVEYPVEEYASELSTSLKTLAQLLKMNLGTQVATVDYGGWDTHVGQGTRFANLVDGLSRSLAAFWTDVKAYQDRITLVVMSEFGRRVRSNSSNGTDHGFGNAMLVMGSHVKGGEMYGSWPDLEYERRAFGVDLAITTDYRIILSEILTSRFGIANPETVFPRLGPQTSLNFMV